MISFKIVLDEAIRILFFNSLVGAVTFYILSIFGFEFSTIEGFFPHLVAFFIIGTIVILSILLALSFIVLISKYFLGD